MSRLAGACRAAVGWTVVVVAVAMRPGLWLTALRQVRRLARPGWWRRPPFLPLPTKEYRELRMVTQYGRPDHRPDRRDVLHYLSWCRQWDLR